MNESVNKWLKLGCGLFGMASIVAYKLCPGSCSYLSGTFVRVDLVVVGTVLMIAYLALLLSRLEIWAQRLIALALGGELFLLGYQIVEQVFCPYCLSFAAAILLLFLLHLKAARKLVSLLLVVSGFVALLLGFSGQLFPAYGLQASEPVLLPSYGNGPVEVRLYTDYFCQPCQAMEKELDSLLPKLLASGKVRITFIDTPIHQHSGTFARYFLYALKKTENEFAQALQLRQQLFQAAVNGVEQEKDLQKFLERAGIAYADFDLMPTLQEYSRLINTDRVNSTPRMVVVKNAEKESFSGARDIVARLQAEI